MSRFVGPNVAVHRAAQVMHRQHRGSFFVVPPAPVESDEPQVTSLGLEVTRTLTILEAKLTEDVAHYELREGDKVIEDGGIGTIADALLDFAVALEEPGEDPSK
jgi:hypothetical protein